MTGNIDISDLIIGGIALISLLWLVISHVISNRPKLKCSFSFVYYVDLYKGISRKPIALSINCVNINDPPITVVEAGLTPPLSEVLFSSKQKRVRFAWIQSISPTLLKRGESLDAKVEIDDVRNQLHQIYKKSCPCGLRYYVKDNADNYYTHTLKKPQIRRIYQSDE